ncbi:hypothetical protein [Plebeiibacterium marinum]|uniref:Uncharacterized protein n=1 Tax=Plebeiibacterium marinum TaxID=2992111 RepID=A0AAE3SKN6_9BACT|nr:hypothetical protein [Plebeiobacterium marinum]MCW3807050.1 hypothetical protein [Plebeiobacterium marinum]
MKKVSKVLLGLVLMLVAISVNAQAAEGEFFVGKWNVIVEGTPQGDSNMEVRVEKQDGKIVCLMQSDAGGEFKPVERLEITDTELTAYWTAGGYNVYLFLEKVEDNKVEGSLMDMFDATGERVVEE